MKRRTVSYLIFIGALLLNSLAFGINLDGVTLMKSNITKVSMNHYLHSYLLNIPIPKMALKSKVIVKFNFNRYPTLPTEITEAQRCFTLKKVLREFVVTSQSNMNLNEELQFWCEKPDILDIKKLTFFAEIYMPQKSSTEIPPPPPINDPEHFNYNYAHGFGGLLMPERLNSSLFQTSAFKYASDRGKRNLFRSLVPPVYTDVIQVTFKQSATVEEVNNFLKDKKFRIVEMYENSRTVVLLIPKERSFFHLYFTNLKINLHSIVEKANYLECTGCMLKPQSH